MHLLEAVLRVNEQQHQQVIALLKKHFPSLKGVRIAVLGLAFKPDTEDMRESPAIPIIDALLAEGARIQAYDPVANGEAQKLLGDRITLVDSLKQVVANSDAVVLVTRWDEFREVPTLLTQVDPQPVLIDGRRMLDKRGIARYEGIGF